MKRRLISLFLVFSTILVPVLAGCSNAHDRLSTSMEAYSSMLENELPEDLQLTIYYESCGILTLKPMSAEDLMNHSEDRKIVVGSAELVDHLELLKTMDASILQPVKKETYINARLYYVFQTSSEKLLEVTVSPRSLETIYGDVVVNGIQVEDNHIFYALISPFLTEDAHNALGI